MFLYFKFFFFSFFFLSFVNEGKRFESQNDKTFLDLLSKGSDFKDGVWWRLMSLGNGKTALMSHILAAEHIIYETSPGKKQIDH